MRTAHFFSFLSSHPYEGLNAGLKKYDSDDVRWQYIVVTGHQTGLIRRATMRLFAFCLRTRAREREVPFIVQGRTDRTDAQ